MIRRPGRPLARVLKAREMGEIPDTVEREDMRRRREALRDRQRQRTGGRLLLMGTFFIMAFALTGVQMFKLAATEPREPRAAARFTDITAQRADIVDRSGRILATNLVTHSLYAQPHLMTDKARAAKKLVTVFPDLNEERLLEQFNSGRKFLWIKKKISPEQKQLVHDIGDPGLLFGPREMRLYPNGKLAAHVLGGTSFGREGVHSAEVIGVAGVERAFDGYLRDPAMEGAPLTLSLDLTVQSTARRVLHGGMRLMNAKGAASVLMDVRTGEIISLISLPDFDPNQRPRPPTGRAASDSPLFNRAVQGVYELGSTFKIFTVAQALDEGVVHLDTPIDTRGPLVWGKYRIRDFHDYGRELSVMDVVVKSSNIGTARIAQRLGAKRQRSFLESLGFLKSTGVELAEAPGAAPLLPPKWSEISTMTISYGHGLSASPLHLAVGYASLLNGGTRVTPTLLRKTGGQPEPGPRVVSETTSAMVRTMLRQVVRRGTASFGEVSGYAVGGKTGTADKPKERESGYYKDRVIATFASVFPAHDPKYVLVVMLDEPSEGSGIEPRRSAGWTAVPVAAEIIRRTAPLLGLRPRIEPGADLELTRSSGN